MNKFKKVAVAAVSVVMAGTMAFSFAACDKDDGFEPIDTSVKTLTDLTSIKQKAWKDLAGWYNGSAKYTKSSNQLAPDFNYESTFELPISIGYNNAKTGTKYNSDLANTVDSGVKIAGYDVKENGFKPAWLGLQDALGLKFKDQYTGSAAGKNISDMKSGVGLNQVAILTASGSTITTESASGTLLNVAEYLDYMPNYKAFLEQNEVVWASLIADASTGAMYMLPYFDGNNDIEKYVLMRKDIVEKLLDSTDVSAATTTFKAQADAKNASTTAVPTAKIDGTKASAESFMGKTGNYTIDIAQGTNFKVDYDAAKTAANNASSELGKAIRAAYSGVATLESGNIVDIQNAVINGTNGGVTGAQLLKITQEYIKVAYYVNDGANGAYTQLYGATHGEETLKLSDVFNGIYAAWDADLYTALGRCYVTSTALLGDLNRTEEYSYLVTGRAKTSQRESDLYSLAGELYGARGLESRNNFAYIDQDGNLKDARADEASWNAVAKLHALAQEGLLDTTTNTPSAHATTGTNTQTLSMHDYVQTQTAQGFSTTDKTKYNYGPILTPVSHWDVDGDGTAETTMRFTESWRGVKDGGLAVSKSYIGSDAKKLGAVLKFIDYCYSNDGQIMMTYGPKSSTDTDGALTLDGDKKKVTANTFQNDGMWYADEVTTWTLEELYNRGVVDTYDNEQYFVTAEYQAQYFMFGNKLYTGTPYLGRQIPTLTKENQQLFLSAAIGNKSFTGYARQYLGTTLPCFNKDQGFEYQCTSECGKEGASIVSNAIVMGLIKHQYQTLNCTDDQGNLITKVRGFGPSMWYTLVPTTLPFDNDVKTSLSTGVYRWLTGNGGDSEYYFCVSSSAPANAYISVIKYGFDSSIEVTSGGITLGNSAADMIAKLEGINS